MQTRYPDSIEEATIDIEINLGERGGLQRFKTINQLNAWITQEQQFWSGILSQRHILGRYSDEFLSYGNRIYTEIQGQLPRWHQLINERNQQESIIIKEGLTSEVIQNARKRVDSYENECRLFLAQLKQRIIFHLQSHLGDSTRNLIRTEPEAVFVAQISETDVQAAAHALFYFLGRRNKELSEFKGRLLASLYDENINRKVRPDQVAFKNEITTWTEELKDFKTRYEAQEKVFAEISQRHQNSEDSWKKRYQDLETEYTTMKENSENELKTLKDTYDAFMQLEAPRDYWEQKRKEHKKGKIIMGWASAIAAVLGAAVLVAVAWFLLPEQHLSTTVPWRQIGFFFLASTFVLWFVRLLVRLMLSHIHLYADAREREVMISTFLALVHRKESREGLKKEDIALVLAPVFRPSTTGVIKDDGGPQSFGDLLSDLTAGRK